MASSVNQTVRDCPADTAPCCTLIRVIQKLTPFTPDQEATRERSAYLIRWIYDAQSLLPGPIPELVFKPLNP